MGFVGIGIKLLEGLFVVGVLGSAVVLLLTSLEDVRAVFQKDESPARPD